MLAIFLNSFFYYFINFSILLVLLFIKFSDGNILKIFILQKKKILITFLSFVLLSLPFLIQLNFGENDYFIRMGGLELSLDQKLYLLKYYFTNLFRLESIILIFLTILIHLYLNKKFVNFKDQVFKLNIFFYFFIASIISPPIFFILSPKIVSIYHFLIFYFL